MGLKEVAAEAGVDIQCITLTAEFEGCLKKVGPDQYGPYLCPANVWTQGIGTTVWPDGRKVSMSDKPITRARAEECLAYDFGKKYMPGVDSRKLPFVYGNMRNACGSFAYNCGVGGFKKSTLAWLIEQKRYESAANEFLRWTRGGGRVLPGLVRRRKAERALFLTPGGTLPGASKTSTVKISPTPQAQPQAPSKPGLARRVFDWLVKTF